MPKELFNQTPIGASPSEPENNDRIAFGQPSVSGAKNWTWANFKSYISNLVSSFDFLDFNPQGTAPTYQEGRLYYDNVKHALTYFNDSSEVAVNLGQEIYFLVENQTGGILTNGTVISPDESTVIAKANSYEKDKSRIIAVLTEDIADSETGYATKLGQVGGLDTSTFSAGQILYLGTDGDFISTTPTDGGYICIVGVVDVVSATDGVITVDTKTSDTTVEVTDTNGFPPDQRSSTTISFVDVTRTFTIAPTGSEFHFYELGDKFSKTTSQNIVIADTTGGHIIYFDGGTISEIVNPTTSQAEDIILNKCIVAYIYWNSSTAKGEIVQDERHGLMQPVIHVYLHQRFGAFYLSGLALDDFVVGNGSLDSHAQFSIASGIIKDEDIAHNINSVASTVGLKYYYRSGVNGDFKSATNAGFSFPVGASPLPQFNEFTGATWQLTEVANGDYMNIHIFANGAIDGNPVVFVGTSEYATIALASAGQTDELSSILSNLPLPEFVLIGSVIIRGRTQFTNSVQAAIYQNSEGQDYTNWTTTELSQGAAPTNHNNLAGLEAANVGVTWGHVSDDYPLQLPSLTTIERDLISAVAGMKIYNTTDSKEQIYNGSSWGNAGSSDIIYKSSGWWSTLNIVTENLLAEDLNRTQIFAQAAGIVTSIKVYIPDLGTNPNSVAVNFLIGVNDLIATNQVLTTGWNTFTTLQNTTVTLNDEIKMAVRTASGNDDIGDFELYITVV